MKYSFKTDNELTLIEFLSCKISGIGAAGFKKLILAREVKINGKRISKNQMLAAGDSVEIFVPKSFAAGDIQPTIVYKDENILVVDKPVLTEVEGALTDALSRQFGFVAPIHRLDKNTTGLVVFALNESARNALLQAVRERRIGKHYVALVLNRPKPEAGVLNLYLKKDAVKKVCYVSETPLRGYKVSQTKYTTLRSEGEITEVHIELVTGRTHQIRASFAHIGHPCLGDGKYGNREINKKYGCKYQMLKAVKIEFAGLCGSLNYLNGKKVALVNDSFDEFMNKTRNKALT